jgi:hypothetical protein
MPYTYEIICFRVGEGPRVFGGMNAGIESDEVRLKSPLISTCSEVQVLWEQGFNRKRIEIVDIHTYFLPLLLYRRESDFRLS